MGLFRRRRGADLPADWLTLVERHVAHWRLLDDDEREVMAAHVAELLATKRWEAARGFELTDRMRVVIAAQASLLVLGLGTHWYREVETVIVHPSTMRVDRVEAGPVPGTEVCGPSELIGEAAYLGPVVIAWDAASSAARHPRRGRDVVLHEFAHKLDMLDEVVDGTPPLGDDDRHDRWVSVCTRAYEDLVAAEGPGLIDDYGATDPGEFFAVITETFFTLPTELADQDPDLYDVLRDFYRQDPAARVRRAAAR